MRLHQRKIAEKCRVRVFGDLKPTGRPNGGRGGRNYEVTADKAKPTAKTRGKVEKKSTLRRTAKTANHFARDIAGMLRSALREGLLLASPCSASERLPEDDSIEREVFTVAEVSKLLHAAGSDEWQSSVFPDRTLGTDTRSARSEDWQGMILVGFYAGARFGDCARRRRRDQQGIPLRLPHRPDFFPTSQCWMRMPSRNASPPERRTPKSPPGSLKTCGSRTRGRSSF